MLHPDDCSKVSQFLEIITSPFSFIATAKLDWKNPYLLLIKFLIPKKVEEAITPDTAFNQNLTYADLQKKRNEFLILMSSGNVDHKDK